MPETEEAPQIKQNNISFFIKRKFLLSIVIFLALFLVAGIFKYLVFKIKTTTTKGSFFVSKNYFGSIAPQCLANPSCDIFHININILGDEQVEILWSKSKYRVNGKDSENLALVPKRIDLSKINLPDRQTVTEEFSVLIFPRNNLIEAGKDFRIKPLNDGLHKIKLVIIVNGKEKVEGLEVKVNTPDRKVYITGIISLAYFAIMALGSFMMGYFRKRIFEKAALFSSSLLYLTGFTLFGMNNLFSWLAIACLFLIFVVFSIGIWYFRPLKHLIAVSLLTLGALMPISFLSFNYVYFYFCDYVPVEISNDMTLLGYALLLSLIFVVLPFIINLIRARKEQIEHNCLNEKMSD